MELIDFLDEEIVCTKLQKKTDREVIFWLGSLMKNAGYVDEAYAQAVWERETVYPTGIENEGFNFAITHASSDAIHKPGVGIAVLEEPVDFHRMDDPEKKTKVRIVLMLSIVDPNSQVKLLQKLMNRLQKTQLFEKLYACQDSKSVIRALCEE